ncbi:putative multi-domain containing protein [Aduncisulcus paluster]|uniref:Multi-domain containing protein n=1 Tax=Aduncisulcus paluster TaxID=2918883 RepID=A0ABQ5KJC8_9EUKA|nr:putative multi-domain containing protein [Aduncisulcus paluster]
MDPPKKSGQITEHLVLDTGAFINFVSLFPLSNYFYVTPAVVKEVKDKKAREALHSGMINIEVLSPDKESMDAILEFSKLCGEAGVLSDTDLGVLALGYMLEKKLKGTVSHLRTKPEEAKPKKKKNRGRKRRGESPPQKDKEEDASDLKLTEEEKDDGWGIVKSKKSSRRREKTFSVRPDEDIWITNDNISALYSLKDKDSELDGKKTSGPSVPDHALISEKEKGETILEGDSTESTHKKEEDTKLSPSPNPILSQPQDIPPIKSLPLVSVMTGDYAMQNVMLQMGIPTFSPNSHRISTLRKYAYRCHACNTPWRGGARRFCPECGHDSMTRVPVTINADGTEHIGIIRFDPSTRGKKFSLPDPQAHKKGVDRHAPKIRLSEDTGSEFREAERKRIARMHKAKAKGIDVQEQQEVAASFFLKDVSGVSSGSGEFSTPYFLKKNPNESRRRTGKKKKGK